MRQSPVFWLALAILLSFGELFIPKAKAAGAANFLSTAVYFDYGNQTISSNTQVNSSAWVVLIASDTIRRAAVFQPDPNNAANNVCIVNSTTTAPNIGACGQNIPGYVLVSTGVPYIDYGHAMWIGRSVAGTPNVRTIVYRDSGDYGNINNINQ